MQKASLRHKIGGQLRAISPTDRPDSLSARTGAPVGPATVRIYVVNLCPLLPNVDFRMGKVYPVVTNVLFSRAKLRSLVRNVPFLHKRERPEVPMGGSAGLGGSLQFLMAKRFKPQYFCRRACSRAGGNLLRNDFQPRRPLGVRLADLAPLGSEPSGSTRCPAEVRN